MKTMMSVYRVIALVSFVLIPVIASAGNHENRYTYKDNEVGGQLLSREMFKQNNEGIVIPVFRYEYAYNDKGEKNEKRIYAWNKKRNAWQKQSFTHINKSELQTIVEIEKWDKAGKSVKSTEKIVYLHKPDGSMSAQYVFIKKHGSKEWIVQDDSTRLFTLE